MTSPQHRFVTLLVSRRTESFYRAVDVIIRALDADTRYELGRLGPNARSRVRTALGSELLNGISLTLPQPRSCDLLIYRKPDGKNTANCRYGGQPSHDHYRNTLYLEGP